MNSDFRRIYVTATFRHFNKNVFTDGYPYYSRPGIVLDDPEFKPHVGGQRRPIQVHVPSKGDVFDIMVSAIQGPGDKPALFSRMFFRRTRHSIIPMIVYASFLFV